MWAGHVCPQGSRPPVAPHISPSLLNTLLAGAALEELGVRVAPISDRIGDNLIEVLKEHDLFQKCIVK